MMTDDASLKTLLDRPASWLVLASAVLFYHRQSAIPLDSPVAMADAFLGRCRAEKRAPRQAAELQLALDINPAARLAFSAAWDRVLRVYE